MNKVVIASTAVAAAGIGLYLLTPMIAAFRIEAELETFIPAPPGVHVEKVSLDEGYFRSTATHKVTVDLDTRFHPLVVYLDHDIEHGLGLDGTVATIHTSVRVDGAYAEPAKALFGDRAPLEATTKVSAWGGLHSSLISPAFSYTPTGDESVVITWEGLRATIRRPAAAQYFEYLADLPGFHVKDGLESMAVTGMTGRGRYIPHATIGGIGESSVKIDQAVLVVDGDRIELDSAAFDYALEEDDGLVHYRMNGAVEALKLPGETVEELGWNFAIDNLNARTYTGFLVTLESMKAHPEAVQLLLTTFIIEQLPTLLSSSPRMRLENLKARLEKGRIAADVSLAVNGGSAAQRHRPDLLGMLEGDLQFVLDEAVLAEALRPAAERRLLRLGSMMAEAPSPEAITAQVDRQIRAMIKMGYFVKEDGRLRFRAEYKNGALTVNGRPGEPMLAAFFQQAPLLLQ